MLSASTQILEIHMVNLCGSVLSHNVLSYFLISVGVLIQDTPYAIRS